MVTVGDNPNTPGAHGFQECNLDDETETCVGDEGDGRSIAPTNYICISKRDVPVDGQFILDLSLSPPPPSPGIVSDENRKNLALHTTNAPVMAEIWTRHDGSMNSKRVSLYLGSINGTVRAIVHDPSCPDKIRGRTSARPFFDMALRANYGDVFLSLPRCFRGPLTIRMGAPDDDRFAFSPALGEFASLISDVPGVRVYFIGARPRSGKWGNGNGGESVEELLDEVTVDVRFSSVRINWDGEDEVPITTRPNDWQVFLGGAERFFTTGRVC